MTLEVGGWWVKRIGWGTGGVRSGYPCALRLETGFTLSTGLSVCAPMICQGCSQIHNGDQLHGMRHSGTLGTQRKIWAMRQRLAGGADLKAVPRLVRSSNSKGDDGGRIPCVKVLRIPPNKA